MIVIERGRFQDFLFIARALRRSDAEELAATRDVKQPAMLALAAWGATYQRVAYYNEEPIFAFGMTLIRIGRGQAWGFGTKKSRLVTRAVTRYLQRTMIPLLLKDGIEIAQAIAHPENALSARWLRHLGFVPGANLAGIGAGGQDMVLWVSTADEQHRRRLRTLAAAA